MIDHLEAVIADLEERIDELEDSGAPAFEIQPLRERLAAYQAQAESEEAGDWFARAAGDF